MEASCDCAESSHIGRSRPKLCVTRGHRVTVNRCFESDCPLRHRAASEQDGTWIEPAFPDGLFEVAPSGASALVLAAG